MGVLDYCDECTHVHAHLDWIAVRVRVYVTSKCKSLYLTAFDLLSPKHKD